MQTTSEMPRVLYPGSFDPLHLGHLEVIELATHLFGDVVVGVMINPAKPSGMFDRDERVAMVEDCVAHLGQVSVASHPGLVVDACRALGAHFVVKGLRDGADLDVELQMAHTNHAVTGMHTVFLPTSPEHGFVSSRFIREIAKEGGDVSSLVPEPVARRLKDRHPR
jgi:pantetheine-phosphate adenylyltransferase